MQVQILSTYLLDNDQTNGTESFTCTTLSNGLQNLP